MYMKSFQPLQVQPSSEQCVQCKLMNRKHQPMAIQFWFVPNLKYWIKVFFSIYLGGRRGVEMCTNAYTVFFSNCQHYLQTLIVRL